MSGQFKLATWHIFSGVFLVFWVLMSYFDNFFMTLILCIGGGFATDNLNQYMKGTGKKRKLTNNDPTPPSKLEDFCPNKPLPPEPPMLDEEDDEDEVQEEIVEERKIEPVNATPFESDVVRDQIKDAIEDVFANDNDKECQQKSVVPDEEEFLKPKQYDKVPTPALTPNNSLDEEEEAFEKDILETEHKSEPQSSFAPISTSDYEDPSTHKEDILVSHEAPTTQKEPSENGDDHEHDDKSSSSSEPIIEPPASDAILDRSPSPDPIEQGQEAFDTNFDKIGNIVEKHLINEPPSVIPDLTSSEVTSKPSDVFDDKNQVEEETVIKLPEEPNIAIHTFDEKQDIFATDNKNEAVEDLLGDFGGASSTFTSKPSSTPFGDDLLVEPSKTNSEVLKDVPADPMITADLLADIQPATAGFLEQTKPDEDNLIDTIAATNNDPFTKDDLFTKNEPLGQDDLVPLDSSLVKHVASTSLEEHEKELAELMKGTDVDIIADANDDDDDVDMELQAVVAKDKDEGDPWILDEKDDKPQEHAGESLVHLDSDELASKDDISHCAVFGDEDRDPTDDLDLDEDEKKATSGGSSSTGSSSGSSSSDGPDDEPVLLDLHQKSDERKSSSSSSEEAIEAVAARKEARDGIIGSDGGTGGPKSIVLDEDDDELPAPPPEVAKAKVEETLLDLKSQPDNLLN